MSGLTSGVTAIAAGESHTCALTSGGGLKCWGYNGVGSLGDGTIVNKSSPIDVPGLTSGVEAVTAGRYHTCAILTGGGVKCWGWNLYGQIGDDTQTDRLSPVDVSGLASGVASIAAGYDHSCALATGGGVKCWGYNSTGQLGDDSTTLRKTPVDVSGLASGVAQISAGEKHTCARTTGAGMKCWGYGLYGQLGQNSTSQFTTPQDVMGLTSGVAAIAVSGWHSCALLTAGSVKCWGENLHGEIGDGTTTDRFTPVFVLGMLGSAATNFNLVLLEGAQESPVNGSTGMGFGTAVVDTAANTILINFTYTGLSSAVTGAHLHGPAARGVNAAVKFAIDESSPVSQAVSYDEADEADILAGLWYVNVHTTNYPAGEIRAQLDNLGAVPRHVLTVANAGTGSAW